MDKYAENGLIKRCADNGIDIVLFRDPVFTCNLVEITYRYKDKQGSLTLSNDDILESYKNPDWFITKTFNAIICSLEK